ncbi:MAG: flavin reductase family protein [Acidimicrobiia bacterium]
MSTADDGGIHDEHPFRTPVAEKDPVRRLRGRLTAAVTIITAGDEDERAGLTVSSVMVAEGEPPVLYALLGPTTDLWLAIEETGRFVVHVAEQTHRAAADVFAGLRPAPGGAFLGRAVSPSEYGPVLETLPNRAYCTLRAHREDGYSVLVTAGIDRVEIADLRDPLTYFRGGYRRLG